MLRSEKIKDVMTPTETFSSIPVRVALPTIDRMTTDDREEPVVGHGGDECGRPRLAAEAWFSGEVGNVVKAVTFIGGVENVAQLAYFHRAPTRATRKTKALPAGRLPGEGETNSPCLLMRPRRHPNSAPC